jgi:hypothetical protein
MKTCFAIGYGFIAALLTCGPVLSSDLIPVPANATQDAFIATVREAYAADLKAAKAPDDRIKLAKKLLTLASESKDDPASQFVLLKDARDLATLAIDIEKAFEAVDQIAERYDVNAIEWKVKVLQDASNAVRPRESNRSIASQGMELVQQAIAGDDFDRAETAAKLAIAAANRVPDAMLIKEAAAVVKEIPTLRTAYRQIQPALQVLVDNPADPSAAVIVGKYYCLVKGDWPKGLPLLAIGNDPNLKSLAEIDVGQPNESAKQVELGDKYWDLAATEQGLKKARLQEHAAEWYSKAVTTLTGITKAKVEKRVAEVAKVQAAKATVGAANRSSTSKLVAPNSGLAKLQPNSRELVKVLLELGFKVSVRSEPLPNVIPRVVTSIRDLDDSGLSEFFVTDLIAPPGTSFSSEHVVLFSKMPDLLEADIRGLSGDFGDAEMESISRCAKLRRILVPLRNSITDKGVIAIGRCQQLYALYIANSSASSDGLLQLSLPELTHLSFQNTRVDDRWVSSREVIFPKLKVLQVKGSRLSPTIIQALKEAGIEVNTTA